MCIRKIEKSFLLFIFFILLISGCRRDPKINPIINPSNKPKLVIHNEFQDNMVIQRDKNFMIWGYAVPNLRITAEVSWQNQKVETISDVNGNWSIIFPPSSANNNNQTITITGDKLPSIILKNILIGDVWVSSGQSNMVMPVDSSYPFRGIINYQQEIANANYPQIRFQTIQEDYQVTPIDTFTYTNKWYICTPQTVGKASAVAYFFAKRLNAENNVPIGVVISAINGTYCSDWLNGKPYNSMINPITKLAIKGFIWYQGENDSHVYPASTYTYENENLIQTWRTAFNQGELPFYFVQMTPFAEDYFSTKPFGGDLSSNYYAKFREAQSNVLALKNTGMAVTMDVGEPDNHHPRNKKPVGDRLALLALKYNYNREVLASGPKFLSFQQNGNEVIINYEDGTAEGLNTIDNLPIKQYFFVAGVDQVFYQAFAAIKRNNVILAIPQNVQTPILAVRYAFTNAPVTNLQNSSGLPAQPFRTDNWDN